jgi:hypothetical protein
VHRLACVALLGALFIAADARELLVHGEGFIFSAREPVGWQANSEDANQLQANLVLMRPGETFGNAAALVRVRVYTKLDEDIARDLNHDMEGYRQQYPGIEFPTLKVSHPKYKVEARLFLLPGRFHEYVAYINPGAESRLGFSVSMNKQAAEATPQELAAFREVIASLLLLKGAA